MNFKFFVRSSTGIALLAILFFFTNCTKEQTNPFIGNPNTTDSILLSFVNDTLCKEFYLGIRQLPYLNQPAPIPVPQNIGGQQTEEVDNYICRIQEVKWSPEFDELYLLDPKNEVIYPSALIDANSLASGAYTPITNVERSPVKLSISLLTKPGEKPYESVEEPSLSNIREGINNLLYRVAEGSTPAFLNFDILEIRAREEAELAIQANFKGWGVKISSSYTFETEQEMSRYLVKFYQKYYTIDLDLPKAPCNLFNEGELPDLDIFNGTSPVFVSSVTYGRMVYFMVESSSSAEKMKAALSASFNSFGKGGGIDVSFEHSQAIQQAKISALVVGGNADGAVKAVNGVEGLLDFLTADGDFSATSPGVPIAYSMRYLKDNSVARIVLNSEYSIRNCEEKGEEVNLTVSSGAAVHDVCPVLVHGDNEFGNPGVHITGNVTLSIRGDKKAVMAKVDIFFDESLPNTDGNDTQASALDEFVAYELHSNDKYISEILATPVSEIDYTPSSNGTHNVPFSGSFLKKVLIQADGGGDDLPCVGYTDDPDGRAFVRLLLKDYIKVFVKKN